MLRGLSIAVVLSGLALTPMASTSIAAEPSEVSDQDIADAYLYLLGRLLVLRQENIDFRDEGFKWNEIIYRTPGGVAWANPNLDVAYSEAWVAVDENTPVILEVPKIEGGRYYSWQMLNGWGETVLNINERTPSRIAPSANMPLFSKALTRRSRKLAFPQFKEKLATRRVQERLDAALDNQQLR
jgi:hypothetical protein